MHDQLPTPEADLLKKICRGDLAALNAVHAAPNAQMVGTGKLADAQFGAVDVLRI